MSEVIDRESIIDFDRLFFKTLESSGKVAFLWSKMLCEVVQIVCVWAHPWIFHRCNLPWFNFWNAALPEHHHVPVKPIIQNNGLDEIHLIYVAISIKISWTFSQLTRTQNTLVRNKTQIKYYLPMLLYREVCPRLSGILQISRAVLCASHLDLFSLKIVWITCKYT